MTDPAIMAVAVFSRLQLFHVRLVACHGNDLAIPTFSTFIATAVAYSCPYRQHSEYPMSVYFYVNRTPKVSTDPSIRDPCSKDSFTLNSGNLNPKSSEPARVLGQVEGRVADFKFQAVRCHEVIDGPLALLRLLGFCGVLFFL